MLTGSRMTPVKVTLIPVKPINGTLEVYLLYQDAYTIKCNSKQHVGCNTYVNQNPSNCTIITNVITKGVSSSFSLSRFLPLNVLLLINLILLLATGCQYGASCLPFLKRPCRMAHSISLHNCFIVVILMKLIILCLTPSF